MRKSARPSVKNGSCPTIASISCRLRPTARMIRGEIDALSQPWPVLKVEGEPLLRDRQINLLVQTGADKHPELAHVPRMIDLARTDEDKALLMLFSSPSTIGRSIAAPPNVPSERIKLLLGVFQLSGGSQSATPLLSSLVNTPPWCIVSCSCFV